MSYNIRHPDIGSIKLGVTKILCHGCISLKALSIWVLIEIILTPAELAEKHLVAMLVVYKERGYVSMSQEFPGEKMCDTTNELPSCITLTLWPRLYVLYDCHL